MILNLIYNNTLAEKSLITKLETSKVNSMNFVIANLDKLTELKIETVII